MGLKLAWNFSPYLVHDGQLKFTEEINLIRKFSEFAQHEVVNEPRVTKDQSFTIGAKNGLIVIDISYVFHFISIILLLITVNPFFFQIPFKAYVGK